MKAIVKKEPAKKAKPFPKLMISRMGTIVLFIRPKVGAVIKRSKISDYDTSYLGWDMSHFSDFNGTVTLSND
jgi:hypothetical protein